MVTIELKFKVGGREVSPNKWRDAIQAELLKEISDQIQQKLTQVRCPDHNEAPRVVAEGPSLDKLEFFIHGCCQKLVDEAARTLS